MIPFEDKHILVLDPLDLIFRCPRYQLHILFMMPRTPVTNA